MKAFILLILLVIIGSLGSAFFYLFRDRGRSPRTVKALTLRIGLSIALFLLLLLAYGLGLLRPHGLRPNAGLPAAQHPGGGSGQAPEGVDKGR